MFTQSSSLVVGIHGNNQTQKNSYLDSTNLDGSVSTFDDGYSPEEEAWDCRYNAGLEVAEAADYVAAAYLAALDYHRDCWAKGTPMNLLENVYLNFLSEGLEIGLVGLQECIEAFKLVDWEYQQVAATARRQEQESLQLELKLPRHLDSSADLDSLHHPKLDGRPWFPYTQEHFMIELKMSPCARLLYNWVLLKAPAGCAFVVDLLDFQAITAEHQRGKPYSMRHIRRAVSQLESFQLIVVKSERVKMVARHPGAVVNSKPKSRTLMSNPRTLMSNPRTLMSAPNAETTQQQESQLSTDLYRSTYRSTAEDTAAAREKSEDRSNLRSATQPENRARETRQETDLGIKPEISHPDRSSAAAPPPSEERDKQDVVDDAGIELNPQLRRLLTNYSSEQVKAAVNHYREAKRKGKEIDKPAAWLTDCLRGQWWVKSNSVQEAKYAQAKPWMHWAEKQGLIYSWTSDREITGCSDGGFYVIGKVTNDSLQPWQVVSASYPMPSS